MSELCEFTRRGALDRALAAHIAALLRDAIAARGRASLAVSGGSTPRGMLTALARQVLPWEKVWITLVDERWVAPDHVDANERLLRETLLTGAAASAHFTSLLSAADTPAAGLAEVAARFADFPLPLSCAVLGMGNDGHTASWFPRAGNLKQLLDPAGSALLGTCEPVTAPHPRITLTLAAVLASSAILLHITGAEKRRVLERAGENNYPVAAITEQTQNPATIWWAP
jgi:6-phosphogluconolactonase